MDLLVDTNTLKLVLCGPVGAGKTTAIRSIADTEPVSTEMPLSEGATVEKKTTTVALDFATVALDGAPPLLIYGVPGQEHFSFMRGIVLEGAVGAIVVLDSTMPTVADECSRWVRAMREVSPDLALVVGVTKTDVPSNFNLMAVRESARRHGPPIPVLTFDARSRDQTAQLVRALLLCLL